MEGAVNPAFQEDSEEESEMRGGVNDSTLVARRHQATVTARGETSRSPTLCNAGTALHSTAACPNRYLCSIGASTDVAPADLTKKCVRARSA